MDLDKLIDKHYGNGKSQNLWEDILRLTEEVFGELDKTNLLTEKEGIPDFDEDKLLMSMIPDIPVSEIGWSDMTTSAEGEEIPGPQRKLLEDYLNNIQGTSLKDKLTTLDTFYTTGYKEVGTTDNRTEAIRNIMSYLVFYKTLTTVITNFNASSAGFSFESFLGVLLKGQQLKANTGTIADFIARVPILPTAKEEGEPAEEYVSLKLYNEDTVEVGGSYQDLIDDIVGKGSMRYLVVTKALRGRELTQRGTLKFYTFNFTLRNIFDILSKSSERSRECMVLPLIKDPADPKKMILASPEAELPGRIRVTFDDVTNLARKKMETKFGELFAADVEQKIYGTGSENISPAKAKDIIYSPYFDLDDPDNQLKITGSALGKPWTQTNVMSILQRDFDLPETIRTNEKIVKVLAKDIILASFAEATKELKTDPEGERRAQVDVIMPSLRGITRTKRKAGSRAGTVVKKAKTSLEWYNALPHDEEGDKARAQALLMSNGYLITLHWALSKGLVTGGGLGKEVVLEIGALSIGTEYVAKMLKAAKDLLNEEIFGIFSALKSLSANLNNFFATGLKNEPGEAALADTVDIETKTKETMK